MALGVPDISVILFIVPGMTLYLNNAMSCMSGGTIAMHMSAREHFSLANEYVTCI